MGHSPNHQSPSPRSPSPAWNGEVKQVRRLLTRLLVGCLALMVIPLWMLLQDKSNAEAQGVGRPLPSVEVNLDVLTPYYEASRRDPRGGRGKQALLAREQNKAEAPVNHHVIRPATPPKPLIEAKAQKPSPEPEKMTEKALETPPAPVTAVAPPPLKAPSKAAPLPPPLPEIAKAPAAPVPAPPALPGTDAMPDLPPLPGMDDKPVHPADEGDTALPPLPDFGKDALSATKDASTEQVEDEETDIPAQDPRLTLSFSPSETELPIAAENQLDDVIDAMKADENIRLRVIAYANASGPQTGSARRISLSRAFAVRSYMVDNDIAGIRVTVKAFGDENAGENADRVELYY